MATLHTIHRLRLLLSKAVRFRRENGTVQTLCQIAKALHHSIVIAHIIEPFHDWRLGVTTTGLIESEQLGLPNGEGAEYFATDYRILKHIMKNLDVEPGKDVFLDYGSGKGRSLVLAAMHPFRRVVGVEFSPQLNAIAEQNIEHTRKKLRCQSIETITCDAALYKLANDVTVIYMYNPFIGETLHRVIERIHESLLAAPRKITLIYTNPRFFAPIAEKLPWITPCGPSVDFGNLTCTVYNCQISPASPSTTPLTQQETESSEPAQKTNRPTQRV